MGKGEMIKCKNYLGISLLSVVGKIYGDILVDWVRSVTDGLTDDEQGGFRGGREYVDQIFTNSDRWESMSEKCRVYVGFMDF